MTRILVIDDEPQVRAMLRQMLEREGYEVVEAEEGEEGLRRYQEQPVDLVITDILMPQKEGIETIRTLRRTNPGVKIIAISGGGRMSKLDLLPIAQTFGAVRTLAKPFERKELLEAVRAVLAQ
ncbi:MAG: response regulator [Thermodesulfobacteriota bacterium]|jgi:CheY-like chemotaxis protein